MSEVLIRDIVKTYRDGRVTALDGISFSVDKGELFGLIGPDGAGKTSLFRILATLLLPEGGEASLGGSDIQKDYKAIRRKIGYMPGRFSLYQDLSVEENLRFFATIFHTTVRENYDLIRDIYVQLEPFRKRRAGKLSGGMKQKLALCCALVHRPEILLLDEPTTGVDAVSRKEFWDILRQLKAEGMTILVSTPYMDEADRCERIALMQNGRILSIDTPGNISRAFPDPMYAIRAKSMSRLLADLRESPFIKSVHSFGESHHITMAKPEEESLSSAVSALRDRGHTVIEYEPIEAGIEDCFMYLMTHGDEG